MSEYKNIKVVNNELAENDFLMAYKSLQRLEQCNISEDKKTIYFRGKSTTKQKYSVDCGAMTSEYNAFIHAIKWYLGRYEYGVKVK